MFDISFTELLVIGVIALVVIGPERLPKVARTIGHLVGRAQRYVSDVKTDIQREVELDELRKLKDQMQDAAQSVQSSLQNTETAMRQPLEAFEQSTMSTLNELKSPLANPDASAGVTPPASSPVAALPTPDASELTPALPSAQTPPVQVAATSASSPGSKS
jgi:sec-independent protein translocase protein TatB